MADDTLNPINIPVPYLMAIGRVSVAWGILEAVVDLAIQRLSGFGIDDMRSAILTAHMTWPLKMDILESLATALSGEHKFLSAFDEVKPLLKTAQEGRNRVSHGQWIYRDGEVLKVRFTARGRLKALAQPITVAEIDGIFRSIHLAGDALMKLIVPRD